MSTEGGDKLSDNMVQVRKLNFVKDGAIKLPPGFRFQPTDQEIVFQYLIRKTISCPLPATIIPELINISKHNPWDLPGDWEQDRYFFSKKNADDSTMYGNGNIGNINYWKGTGVDKRISPPATIRCFGNSRSRKEIAIMGMKKTLVFFKAGRRTRWIMHEYRLLHSLINHPTTTHQQKSWVQMGDWVLCHVLIMKRKTQTTAFEDINKAKISTSLDLVLTTSTQQKWLSDSISSSDDSPTCSSDSSVTTEVSSS